MRSSKVSECCGGTGAHQDDQDGTQAETQDGNNQKFDEAWIPWNLTDWDDWGKNMFLETVSS